jgi:hypothetical protein
VRQPSRHLQQADYPCSPHCEGYLRERTLLGRILEFLDEEADNRAFSGSEMSDYEREVRDLADELREWLSSTPAKPLTL